MFASRRHEIRGPECSVGLGFEMAHDFGQSDALLIARRFRVAAKVAYRLKMHAAYSRGMGGCQPNDRPQIVVVYSRHERGDQYNAHACLGQCPNGRQFDLQQGTPSQYAVNVVICSVELQEDRVQSCIGQCGGIAGFLSESQSVGIQLDEGETASFAESDQVCQVVAHRGFATGKLDIAKAGRLMHAVEQMSYFFGRWVGRCAFTG